MPRRVNRSVEGKLLVLIVSISAAASLTACGWWQEPEPAITVAGGNVEQGREALTRYGCIACHTIPGAGIGGAQANVGPPLTDWAEREYIAGSLTNTPENLIRWIQNPQAIEPGTVMPTLGVSEADARDMAAYLYTLE